MLVKVLKETQMNKYVVVDIETTGAHPLESEIIEIGAVYIEDGQVKKKFNELVKPTQVISDYIISITGITNEMVADAPPIEEVMPRFIAFCEDVPLIGHNIILFDYRMLKAKATALGFSFEKKGIDTLVISRRMLAHLPSRKLGDLCEYYGISLENAHRAYDDAFATYELYEKLKSDFEGEEGKLFKPEVMRWEVPKIEPMTAKQKKYLESLCRAHHIALPQGYEKYSKSECSKTIDKIIVTHGKLRY